MGCTLHQHGHSHGGGSSHGHSHESKPDEKKTQRTHQNGGFERDADNMESGTREDPKECSGESENSSSSDQVAVSKPNINVRAAFIHVLGDFLQSVGVFAAAVVIYFEVITRTMLPHLIANYLQTYYNIVDYRAHIMML